MPLDIKICGLKTREAIDRATTRGATHLGFIHFAKSPRHLTVDEMADLRRAVPETVKLVVVTVDAADEVLDAISRRVRPDMLQLHGKESPERVADVKPRTSLPVMKALSVGSAADLGAVALYSAVADRVLLDAKAPKGSALPGGNGIAFDWDLLSALGDSAPYILSGGLHAGNVAQALRRLSPAGIDVSSGVESAPGVKDVALIDAFFDAIGRSDAGRPAILERKAS